MPLLKVYWNNLPAAITECPYLFLCKIMIFLILVYPSLKLAYDFWICTVHVNTSNMMPLLQSSIVTILLIQIIENFQCLSNTLVVRAAKGFGLLVSKPEGLHYLLSCRQRLRRILRSSSKT